MASFDRLHAQAVATELARQPVLAGRVLADADLIAMPPPVARFVRASGAVGRPIPQNVRAEMDARMWRKPGQAPMRATSVQLNVFARPARLFLMQARMFGLPVRALHLYREERATFQVRVLDLFSMVDQSGPGISRVETVTVLNDLCFLAPGTLTDGRLAWRPIDDRTAGVTFTNGPHRVTATLRFNERDELVDFWSDDRSEPTAEGVAPERWNTPMGAYRDIDGLRLPTQGAAVWNRPAGPFTYGEFQLRSLRYDVNALEPTAR